MRILRWILFIPIAAVVAVSFGFIWANFSPKTYFSGQNIFLSLVGLTPLYLGRLLPIVVFILLGWFIVPTRGRVQIILLGVLGGIFGWPFGPQYSMGQAGVSLYLLNAFGTLSGVLVGMLTAFWLNRKKTANSGQ